MFGYIACGGVLLAIVFVLAFEFVFALGSVAGSAGTVFASGAAASSALTKKY